MTEYQECPHGRHVGAYCEPCRVLEAERLWTEQNGGQFTVKTDDRPYTNGALTFPDRQSGLNASYYDIPKNLSERYGDGPSDYIKAEHIIYWLEEGGMRWNGGNQFKSLIRQYNPDCQKDTNELYEAEKRFHYALNDLRSVQKRWAAGGIDSPDVEEGLGETTEE